MNTFKKTIILLGILVGLILVVLLAKFLSGKSEKVKSSAALFKNFTPEKVKEIIVAARWNTAKLVQTPAGWVVATADSFPADTSEVNKVISTLQGFTPQELVSTNSAKQQLFQVDSLSGVRVCAVAQNKDTIADVMIGKNGMDYNSTYFRPTQAKNVYLSGQNLRYLFSKNSVNWRDSYVLKVDRESVTMLALEYPGQTLELVKNAEGTWKISKPQAAAAKQNLVNDMINTAAMLSSTDMQRMNAADTAYGFNKSPCTVMVATKNNGRFMLVLGAFNEKEKCYYIKNNFRNYVYKINDYQANTMMKRFEELKEDIPADTAAAPKTDAFQKK